MLVPLVGAAVLYYLVRVAGGAWLALASEALLVLPLVAALLPPRLDGITVRRDVPDRCIPGQEVEVALVVRNEGRRTTAPLRLGDVSDGLSSVVVAVPALRPGGRATVRVRRTATRRGVFSSGRAVLTSTAPLGMMRVSSQVVVDGLHIVHPEVTRVALVAGAATNAPGEVPIPVPGVGTEVLGLREWRSGDSARAVSARATARHGRPLVLERERDAGSALVLLAGGPGRGPAWEAAVSRAASIAIAAVSSGSPPLLLGAPPPARMDRTGVLDWFAGVDAVRGLTPEAVSAGLRAAAGGALVVLVPTDLLVDRLELRRACDAARTHLLVLDA